MPVKQEIKSHLARLLATEDLVVEHKKVDTACFNVDTRVLTLPMWEKASDNIYTMLVLHEVSHALWTPNIDWSVDYKIPNQYVNIVEDVRVEKLCKRKYPGSPKSFYAGYKELHDDDFFMIENDDISTYNLADRVNLYFKVGSFISLTFNSKEKELVDEISSVETFKDALIAAEKLYNYCKDEQHEKVANLESQNNQQGDSESPSDELIDVNESKNEVDGSSNSKQPEENKEVQDSDNPQNQNVANNLPSETNGPEVRTVDSLDNNIRKLVNEHGPENIYVEIPKLDLDRVIAKNSDIHKTINTFFQKQQEIDNEWSESYKREFRNVFEIVDTEYKKFKKSSQKEVNYLVKEFECRKAADSYSRSTVSRTGVLDTSRLHSYKFSEDLFKKISVLPDGKNHGLVFVLDWSGSMSEVLLDTCKQLFNLIWFCKKVSIPFEVYAFTNEWKKRQFDADTNSYKSVDLTPFYEKKEGVFVIHETFTMMNLLSSKVSAGEFDNQLKNIWRIAYCFSNRGNLNYTYPSELCLSGTPLNESLMTLHQIIPQFQSQNKLQKVHCIVLTDGEAHNIGYHKKVHRHWEKEPILGTCHIDSTCCLLRDKKIGRIYKFDASGYYESHKFTDVLLENLKDNFPNVNFIGIRILSTREAFSFINRYHSTNDKNYKTIYSDWKKVKSFTITNSGYHAYFGMSSSALSQDSEFEVNETATKAQIKSAFSKSLKAKKFNKKVLGEFIELVV